MYCENTKFPSVEFQNFGFFGSFKFSSDNFTSKKAKLLSAQIRGLQQINTQIGPKLIGESACKVIENQLLVEEKSKLKDEVQELKSTISAPNHEIEALKNKINDTKNSNRLCQAKQNDKIKQVCET